ncbi:hypothetical protein D3C86_1931230 [compost metagenome]
MLLGSQILVLTGNPKRLPRFQYGVKVAVDTFVFFFGPRYIEAEVLVINAFPVPPGAVPPIGRIEK